MTCKNCGAIEESPQSAFYVRSICVNGTFQIWTRCPSCQKNAFGTAIWIPRRVVVMDGLDPDTLPLVERNATPPPSFSLPWE